MAREINNIYITPVDAHSGRTPLYPAIILGGDQNFGVLDLMIEHIESDNFNEDKKELMNEESNISHNHGTSLKGEHESISGADQGGPALHQAVLQQISPTL